MIATNKPHPEYTRFIDTPIESIIHFSNFLSLRKILPNPFDPYRIPTWEIDMEGTSIGDGLYEFAGVRGQYKVIRIHKPIYNGHSTSK